MGLWSVKKDEKIPFSVTPKIIQQYTGMLNIANNCCNNVYYVTHLSLNKKKKIKTEGINDFYYNLMI